MKNVFVFVIVTAFGICSSIGPTMAANLYHYDASLGTFPKQQGFTLFEYRGRDNEFEIRPPEIIDGVLHQYPGEIDNNRNGHGSTQVWYQDGIALDFVNGTFILEADLHVIRSNHVMLSTGDRTGYYLSLSDDAGHYFAGALAGHGVSVITDAGWIDLSDFDTTDAFHKYSFVIDRGKASLFIDDNLVVGNTLVGDKIIDSDFVNRVGFGDAAGWGISETKLKSFSFSNLMLGDFDRDDALTVLDVDTMRKAIQMPMGRSDIEKHFLDLDANGMLDAGDLGVWVHDVKHTWFGDADLNGRFDSRDFVRVFQVGEYEDKIELNSTWATGDWNADGEFTSADLTLAFQDGGYERAARLSAQVVPEPGGYYFFVIAFAAWMLLWRRSIR